MLSNRIIPTKCSKNLKESDPMRKLISFFCCFLTFSVFANGQSQQELILSTPEQLAALTCEPDFLIGGLIGPLGGHPTLRETDLVVKGAQNIALTRIYIPPYMPCSFPKHKRCQEEYDKKYLYYHLANSYQGWQFFPHTRLQYEVTRKEVRFSEPNGATFDFNISKPKTTLASPPYAINNLAGDAPSGKYDPRNTRVTYENQGDRITVYAADGSVRYYNKKQILTLTGYLLYLLDKEILPNGKILRYRYDPYFNLITFIQYNGQYNNSQKVKTYSWYDNQWLKSIELRDGQNNLQYKKSYEYDRFGNPILEIFTGDLTGSGTQESTTIRREFSQDGRHLLLKEEHDNGKSIHFSYLPKTNLVTTDVNIFFTTPMATWLRKRFTMQKTL